MIFFSKKKMSAEAINKVSEEEIKYITDEAFDWIFKNLVTLAMEILKETKEEKNEEKFAKLKTTRKINRRKN